MEGVMYVLTALLPIGSGKLGRVYCVLVSREGFLTSVGVVEDMDMLGYCTESILRVPLVVGSVGGVLVSSLNVPDLT